MRGLAAVLAAGLLLSGCGTAQLNRNTLDLASTVASLQTDQVTENLARFVGNPDAIPAQVALAGGVVQVNNVLNPSWTLPYDFLQTAPVAASAAKEFHLGYTNQWVQNWNLVPVSDAQDLRRLRALYRYAVYGDAHDCKARCSAYDFTADYRATFVRDLDGRPHPIAPVPRIHDQIHTGWLYWSGPQGGPAVSPSPPKAPLYAIGSYGGRTLYTTNRTYFSDFVIAVLGAAVQARTMPRAATGPLLNP